MINKEEYLFITLMEECAEVTQRISKILRFGLHEKQEGQFYTNRERFAFEFDDLMGTLKSVNNESELDYAPDPKAVAKKQARIEQYFEYSKEQGVATDA